MGEFFILLSMMVPALFVAPMIVLSYARMLAPFLLFGKGMNPAQAITMSNEYTDGYKLKMFFIQFLFDLANYIIMFLLMQISVVLGVFVYYLLSMVGGLGIMAVFYKKLVPSS